MFSKKKFAKQNSKLYIVVVIKVYRFVRKGLPETFGRQDSEGCTFGGISSQCIGNSGHTLPSK